MPLTESQAWAFRVLARAAVHYGRMFVVFLASALVVLVLAGGTCACNGRRVAAPDAAQDDAARFALTECVTDAGTFEVTCGSNGAVFCSRAGAVVCDLPDAGRVECCKH